MYLSNVSLQSTATIVVVRLEGSVIVGSNTRHQQVIITVIHYYYFILQSDPFCICKKANKIERISALNSLSERTATVIVSDRGIDVRSEGRLHAAAVTRDWSCVRSANGAGSRRARTRKAAT